MKIGAKIKQLRVANNLTQEELATRADLTKGFISLVERDESSISVDTLVQILDVFGVDLADFFRQPEQDREKVVFGRADRIEIDSGDEGEHIELLVPRAQNRGMDPVVVTLDPGAASEDEPHEGEEFGIVLDGKVALELEGHTRQQLRKGDCFYFSSSGAHRVVNQGERPARLLWVVTPPTFH